LIGARSRD